MQLLTLDHSTLVVKNLEQSRRFYGDVLGLREIPRPGTFTFGGLWFQGPEFQIHLIDACDTSAPSGFGVPREAARTGRGHHLAFEVAQLEECLAHFAAHRIEIVGGPQPRGDGVIQVFVEDPDGHLLEFFAWEHNESRPLEARH
jgi:catechol 2,3-dioxygenase-like lactoylglutathione lyase family enzyme